MELLFQFLLLCAGLVFLWKTGALAVRSAIGFSLIYKIEKFTIGFFIFAISTGLPEISTAIVSSFEKVPELSGGDLMGSTFVNISMILGITILLAGKINIESPLRKKLFRTIGLITIIFAGIVLIPDERLFTGILLIIIYAGSLFWFQVGIPKKPVSKEIKEVKESVEKIKRKTFFPPKIDILLKLSISLLFLLLSSWLTVHSATKIAIQLNINLSLLGATLIAIGTSLPELALEVHAIRQREYALALGDIFGSSLLNISLILGILLLINPHIDLTFGRQILPFLLAAIFWFIRRLIQKKPLFQKDGWIFLGLFLLYLSWTIGKRIYEVV